ncbi:hypothetical protein GCM10025868_45750 [Angustibacter aerolatus]|uniref:Uncharacterized protein n=1 Tax=Angustibacter aerolatus TaxID=1162965 RepID=A0ABQ6JM21_9ACTN|nr:hypothetical protein GCM10025868_45750 [Angustibacter aerolatus]
MCGPNGMGAAPVASLAGEVHEEVAPVPDAVQPEVAERRRDHGGRRPVALVRGGGLQAGTGLEDQARSRAGSPSVPRIDRRPMLARGASAVVPVTGTRAPERPCGAGTSGARGALGVDMLLLGLGGRSGLLPEGCRQPGPPA